MTNEREIIKKFLAWRIAFLLKQEHVHESESAVYLGGTIGIYVRQALEAYDDLEQKTGAK